MRFSDMARLARIDALDEAIRQELDRAQAGVLYGTLDPDWAIRRVRKWLDSKRRADDEALYIDGSADPHCYQAVVRLIVVALHDSVWLDAGWVFSDGRFTDRPTVGRLFVYSVLYDRRELLHSWIHYVLGKYGLVFPSPGMFDGLRLVRGACAASVYTESPRKVGLRFWFCTRYAYWEVPFWINDYQSAVRFLRDQLGVRTKIAARILAGDLSDEVQAEIALGKLAL